MEDHHHEQPVTNEAAPGSICLLSALEITVDKSRLMDWKELTGCLVGAQTRSGCRAAL